ncbi:MAG: alpha/beta fold hydrolase [Chitinophagales bacterium]
MPLQEESLYIPISETDTLHLKRIFKNPKGEPVFLLHGSIENGMIFYSKNLKGYAPFLAEQGYDVFIADFQGRGKSTPAINRHSTYGQVDIIKTDIPAFLEKIKEIKGDIPIHWGAHSWGGVLALAYIARFQPKVKSLVLFGAKRRLTIRNWEYFTQLIINWHLLGNFFMWVYGFLPAKRFGFGAENEPRVHFYQINKWLGKKSKWIDNVDDYDYGDALQKCNLPPCLFLAGKKDTLLGHPQDVKLLMSETHNDKNEYWLLAKEKGFAQDYGHIDMLTHRNAKEDHFMKVVEWMKRVVE